MNSYQQRLDRLSEQLGSGNILEQLTDEELEGITGLAKRLIAESGIQESAIPSGRSFSEMDANEQANFNKSTMRLLQIWRTTQAASNECRFITPALTACPTCVREGGSPMDVLTFEREGVVSCRYHGEMRISDIPALSKGDTPPRKDRQALSQTQSASDSDDKS